MAFEHNSKLADREPDWGSVDRTKLPRIAFAEKGEAHKKSTWRYPHHWVRNGAGEDENGCYTTGTLYLHRGGLAAAWQRANQRGTSITPEARRHLDEHRAEIEMGQEHHDSLTLPLSQGARDRQSNPLSQGARDQQSNHLLHQNKSGLRVALNAEVPADVPEWVMICRTGNWRGHPEGPELITSQHLRAALDYFNRHYRGRSDLVIDYHHSSAYAGKSVPEAPAAGWIKEMELRNGATELWARVLWLADAARDIAQRRFRYLSPWIRFNMPDRVTGEPVPMVIHSVALTNTPFLTELEALNENAGTDAGVISAGSNTGGGRMPILEAIAEALQMTPEQVASGLGLEGAEVAKLSAEAPAKADRIVAEAIMNAVGALREPPGLPASVANALGVAVDADEKAVAATIIRLKAPAAGLANVRQALALDEGADEQAVLDAISALREDHRRSTAEALVDEAIGAGKIPPAHRSFFLNSALSDLEATRLCLENMPCIVATQTGELKGYAMGRQLNEAETLVCRQLGISAQAFLNAAHG